MEAPPPHAHSTCSGKGDSVLPAERLSPTYVPVPANDPFIQAIAERIRGVFAHQSRANLDALADTLKVSPEAFRQLIEDGNGSTSLSPDRGS